MSASTQLDHTGSLNGSDHNAERIQEIVVQRHRSLLQYADLRWPWGELQDCAERNILKTMAARQREGIRKLVLLLDRRGWAVDYGQFSDHFKDFTFVAVDHLWQQVVKSEHDLLAELHEVRQDVIEDDDAVKVLDQCIAHQREILTTVSEHVVESRSHANQRNSERRV
ncbi:hypothetical protein [Fuerstiella marisgermanici]|uniref:Uncharacterized protein n=1 Tax=Fuerstiella marisgermanici TaxID=1891926 RepID=A0A1P8WE21_9PLAN|nr:hypothetical protein [Fuerstiella marisgermanici]APZ92292.1 hypothetical protein Fuma_01902 [Fuerstiella marisgermanici]